MTRHIVITGPMGIGKTTTGRQLAKALGLEFADNDESIERSRNATGREIASNASAAALHQIEHDFLRNELQQEQPRVIAAAASVADDPALLASVDAAGAELVFLEAGEADLADMGVGGHRRPIEERVARDLYRKRRMSCLGAGAVMVPGRRDSTLSRIVTALRSTPRSSS